MAHLIWVLANSAQLGYRLPCVKFSPNWCTILPSSRWPLLTSSVERVGVGDRIHDINARNKGIFPSTMFEPKSIAQNLKPLARRFFARLSPSEHREVRYPRTEVRVCKNSSFKRGWRTKWEILALTVWDKWISPGAPKIRRRKSRRIRNRKMIEARFKLPMR